MTESTRQDVVNVGDKLHIITRRNYAEDLHRHFAGTIEAVSEGHMRLHGYTFVIDQDAIDFRRGPELHNKIYPISSAQLIINVLPSHTIMDDLEYRRVDGRLTLVDGARLRLDVNESDGIS